MEIPWDVLMAEIVPQHDLRANTVWGVWVVYQATDFVIRVFTHCTPIQGCIKPAKFAKIHTPMPF